MEEILKEAEKWVMYKVGNNIYGCRFTHKIINKEDAEAMVNMRHDLTDAENILVLVDIKKLETVTKEAREVFSDKKASEGILAAAIIADNSLNKLMANFYLNFNKPPVPIKIFTKEEEAMAWLVNRN